MIDEIKSGFLLIAYLITFLIILLIAGCAEIGPPPGGEVDKTAPGIISSQPANQAVNVVSGNEVNILFSERIRKPADNNGLFISPRPHEAPDIKWGSDNLQIIFKDSFKTDQTYLIRISSDIKDLRNNPFDSNTVVAFSTGDKLEGQVISGIVTDTSHKPLGGIMVGLYENPSENTEINYETVYPEYLMKTGKDGRFIFEYLPEKIFRLIAFNDQNQDDLFNPVKERYGVSDRAIAFESELRLDRLKLTMGSKVSAGIEIIKASLNGNNLLELIFAENIKPDYLLSDITNFRFQAYDDTSKIIHPEEIFKTNAAEISAVKLYVPKLDESKIYRLKINFAGNIAPYIFDSLTVEYKEDKYLPEILNVYPQAAILFSDELKPALLFNEPIDTAQITPTTFSVWDKDENPVDYTLIWHDLFNPEIVMSNIAEGNQYQLRLTEFEISDLAGNVLGDSLSEYTYRTFDADSLGEVSGRIDIKIKDQQAFPVWLKFSMYGSNQTYTTKEDSGQYSISLPSGKYMLSSFVDKNKNSIQDFGSVKPFEFSELSAIYADTVVIRARFETSDINLLFE